MHVYIRSSLRHNSQLYGFVSGMRDKRERLRATSPPKRGFLFVNAVGGMSCGNESKYIGLMERGASEIIAGMVGNKPLFADCWR